MHSLNVVPVGIEQVRSEIVGRVLPEAGQSVVPIAALHARAVELPDRGACLRDEGDVEGFTRRSLDEGQRAELDGALGGLLDAERREHQPIEGGASRRVGHWELDVIEHRSEGTHGPARELDVEADLFHELLFGVEDRLVAQVLP